MFCFHIVILPVILIVFIVNILTKKQFFTKNTILSLKKDWNLD